MHCHRKLTGENEVSAFFFSFHVLWVWEAACLHILILSCSQRLLWYLPAQGQEGERQHSGKRSHTDKPTGMGRTQLSEAEAGLVRERWEPWQRTEHKPGLKRHCCPAQRVMLWGCGSTVTGTSDSPSKAKNSGFLKCKNLSLSRG